MIPVKTKEELYVKETNDVQFGMVVDAKAFSILSDSLYTNKIRAVVREYMTNAYDSHVDAGYPEKPFKLHVPTKLEPYFEVQDYGVGLDKDGVEKVFCTFFHSTKENSNESNGCLGLGSKSVFSLSSQASLTSIKDNTRYTYSLHKNSKGEPVAKLVQENTTEEGNGVSIKIPVNPNDIWKWEEEISYVITGFKAEPILNTRVFLEESDWYGVMKDVLTDVRESSLGVASLNGHNKGVSVLMGNVLYPVDKPEQYLKNDKIRSMYKQVRNLFSVVVKADLGEMMVAPSREALSMCDTTRRALSRKLTKLFIVTYYKLFGNHSVNWDSLFSIVRNFKNTDLWDVICEMDFKGTSIRRWCTQERYWKFNESLLLRSGLDKEIKGLVPRVGYPSLYSYSSKVLNMSQHRVLSFGKVVVCHGENKLNKLTLENVQRFFNGSVTVLFTDDLDYAKVVAKYFDSDCILDVKDYLASPKKRKSIKRKSFGKLEDYTCLGRTANVEGNISKQAVVDLTEEGLYYCDSEDLNLSHLSHCCSWTSNRVRDLMGILGVNKLVLKNKLNKNKINKSGIKNFVEEVDKLITKHKVGFIKKEVRFNCNLNYGKKSKFLNPLCKSYQKITKLKSSVGELPDIKVNVEALGWKSTPLYNQEINRISNLVEKFSEEYASLERRLPLIDKLYTDEDIEYYLKLEKLIK